MREQVMILGGATYPDSIGQQCTVVDVQVRRTMQRIMVDCGLELLREREQSERSLPDFSFLNDGKKIDAVYLTHGHLDHVGGVAALVKRKLLSENAKIFASPQTISVLPIVLLDGLRNARDEADLLYDYEDAAALIDRCVVIPEPGEFELLDGLPVFISQMGHIPGEAGIVIPTRSGKKGFIPGDISWKNYPIVKGALLPSDAWPAKWIPDEIWGTDLTYGPALERHTTLEAEVERFVQAVIDALRQGKTVIIAAFGNGKGQSSALWLGRAKIPVWIDGSIRQIYDIFAEHRWSERDEMLPSLGNGALIQKIETARDREDLIASRKNPTVFITTSGMGDFGPIVRYMEEFLPRQDACFFFTSYLAPGCAGDRLLRSNHLKYNRYFTLTDGNGMKKTVPVRAAVDRFSLSSHQGFEENMAFFFDLVLCRGAEPLERVIMTHGTPTTKLCAVHELYPTLAKSVVYGERGTVVNIA